MAYRRQLNIEEYNLKRTKRLSAELYKMPSRKCKKSYLACPVSGGDWTDSSTQKVEFYFSFIWNYIFHKHREKLKGREEELDLNSDAGHTRVYTGKAIYASQTGKRLSHEGSHQVVMF